MKFCQFVHVLQPEVFVEWPVQVHKLARRDIPRNISDTYITIILDLFKYLNTQMLSPTSSEIQ
jgi:hypothetical protein